MNENESRHRSGHVGRRGAIILPAVTRRRYGLTDGSLYISEEREEGILIRKAEAIPVPLQEVRTKIQQGLDELRRGEGLAGDEVEAELRARSRTLRRRKRK